MAVRVRDKRPVPCSIENLSLEGIAVRFSPAHGVELKLEDVVYLELRSRHVPEPIVAFAKVCSRTESHQGRGYGLHFVDWLGLFERLTPELKELFNHRGGPRVRPAPGEAIPVALKVEHSSELVAGTLRDLSAMGLSVLAPVGAEDLLVRTDQVLVTFHLPTCTHKLDFAGQIMHRSLDGGATLVRYGIVLDRDGTPQFERLQAALLHYVALRRREQPPRPVEAQVEEEAQPDLQPG